MTPFSTNLCDSLRPGGKEKGGMMDGEHAVLVLDDDVSILRELGNLLAAHGYSVRPHSDPDDLLNGGPPPLPACLLLENQFSNGMTGLRIHSELRNRGWEVPTIFLTAHWTVRSVVTAMRAGADGFLTKPHEPGELLDAVSHAMHRSLTMRRNRKPADDARARAALLTPREREVVRMVVSGLLNKEIADLLGLALVTVKVHRGQAMQKLMAGNPVELARIAMLAGLVSGKPSRFHKSWNARAADFPPAS
jgi:FixJ family two-component response regulator